MSLQRTWIQANGDKGKLDSPRMLVTKDRKRGGAIRLWPDEAVATIMPLDLHWGLIHNQSASCEFFRRLAGTRRVIALRATVANLIFCENAGGASTTCCRSLW